MNNIYKRMFAVSLLFIIIALAGVKGAESGEKAKPDLNLNSGIGIKAINERLVAKDVTTTKPFWCGPGHMLAYSKDDGGLLLQNVDTGEVTIVSDDPYNRMIGCTNDGRWFVYYDVNAYHKGTEENPKYGNEMVRYEVATGRREAFAIVYGAEAVFSPLDDSLYLAGPHPKRIEMSEPKWDIIWSGNEYSGYLRLGEPSVVIGGGVVHVLEPERRSFEFDLPGYDNFTPVFVDNQNRFYARVIKNYMPDVVRCSVDIQKEIVECEPFLEGVFSTTNFDIFKDGNKVLKQGRNYNLVEINIESGESRHIVELNHTVDWYLLISQDESMAAFDSSRDRDDGTASRDLYVVDLPKSK